VKIEGMGSDPTFPWSLYIHGWSQGPTNHPASWGKNSSFSNIAWLSWLRTRHYVAKRQAVPTQAGMKVSMCCQLHAVFMLL